MVFVNFQKKIRQYKIITFNLEKESKLLKDIIESSTSKTVKFDNSVIYQFLPVEVETLANQERIRLNIYALRDFFVSNDLINVLLKGVDIFVVHVDSLKMYIDQLQVMLSRLGYSANGPIWLVYGSKGREKEIANFNINYIWKDETKGTFLIDALKELVSKFEKEKLYENYK